MRGQALQVVGDGDAGWGARVEAGEATVAEGDVVVEPDELEQHVADYGAEGGGVAGAVVGGEEFRARGGLA